MDRKMQMLDFFGMEASEYLEKLDALVSGGQRPETVEFVRLARALRGSAMMASQHVIADAASGLETFARALHQTEVDWDAGSRQVVIRAVDDLKIVVRRLAEWNDDDETRIRAITADLHELAGGTAREAMPDPGGLDTGTRAFIGREGSAVASALHRASQTAGTGTLNREVVGSIMAAIQPLQGIASLNDVPPLPDLLAGVERVTATCSRQPDRPVPRLKEILHMGAEAISRVAREVAATGKPDPDSEEAGQFTRLLRRAFEGEGMVIPIEDLYFDDGGPHIITRGTVPEVQALDSVELVARGEHLRLAADQLDEAGSATQRDLRLQALEAELMTLARAAGNEISASVSDLARGFQSLIDSVRDRADSSEISNHLRSAAAVLTEAATVENATLIERLRIIGAALRQPSTVVEASLPLEQAVAETAVEPETAPEAEPETGVMEADDEGLPDQSVEAPTPVVGDDLPYITEDIEAPTPDDSGRQEDVAAALPASEPEQEVVAPAKPAPADKVASAGEHEQAAVAGTDLAAAYTLYEMLVSTADSDEPSLDVLMAGPPTIAQSESALAAAPLPEPDMSVADESLPEQETVPEEMAATEDTIGEESLLGEEMPVAEPSVAVEPVASEGIPSTVMEEQSSPGIVPIEELLVPVTEFCYSGRAALEHALSLSDDLRLAVENRESPDLARELIDEVLDLIELGISSTVE